MRQTTPKSATPNENAGIVDAASGIALAITSRCRPGPSTGETLRRKTVVQRNKVFGHERRRALKHPTLRWLSDGCDPSDGGCGERSASHW